MWELIQQLGLLTLGLAPYWVGSVVQERKALGLKVFDGSVSSLLVPPSDTFYPETVAAKYEESLTPTPTPKPLIRIPNGDLCASPLFELRGDGVPVYTGCNDPDGIKYQAPFPTIHELVTNPGAFRIVTPEPEVTEEPETTSLIAEPGIFEVAKETIMSNPRLYTLAICLSIVGFVCLSLLIFAAIIHLTERIRSHRTMVKRLEGDIAEKAAEIQRLKDELGRDARSTRGDGNDSESDGDDGSDNGDDPRGNGDGHNLTGGDGNSEEDDPKSIGDDHRSNEGNSDSDSHKDDSTSNGDDHDVNDGNSPSNEDDAASNNKDIQPATADGFNHAEDVIMPSDANVEADHDNLEPKNHDGHANSEDPKPNKKGKEPITDNTEPNNESIESKQKETIQQNHLQSPPSAESRPDTGTPSRIRQPISSSPSSLAPTTHPSQPQRPSGQHPTSLGPVSSLGLPVRGNWGIPTTRPKTADSKISDSKNSDSKNSDSNTSGPNIFGPDSSHPNSSSLKTTDSNNSGPDTAKQTSDLPIAETTTPKEADTAPSTDSDAESIIKRAITPSAEGVTAQRPSRRTRRKMRMGRGGGGNTGNGEGASHQGTQT